MKQTAVEWLDLHLLGLISFDSEELRAMYKERIQQAKELEKQKDAKYNEMLEMLNTIYLSLDDLWQKNDKNEIFNIINVLEIEKLIKEATEI